MARYKKGDTIANRFDVHQALKGGMGQVYLGYDQKANSPYALKTFQARLSGSRAREIFRDEADKWVQLGKHPNIVRCYAVDRLANQPFVFLEWVAGKEEWGTDLRSWLQRGPLSLQLALDFTIDICRGLIYADQKQPGIVHRDLKPGNILIGQAGTEAYIAKITDFGLAKVAQETRIKLSNAYKSALHAHPGSAVGTPPYMSPEQWRDEALDARADIYAIGGILHEMLTGKLPFEVNIRPRTRRQFRKWLSAWQTHHTQSPLPTLPASVPEGVATIMQTCLAKEREQRFATVDELLAQLTELYQQLFAHPPKQRAATQEFSDLDYNNRGLTYNTLQRYDDALADYGRAIELNPDYAPAYNNRGTILDRLKRHDEALVDYGRALQLNPEYANAYFNRGNTFHTLERYDEALADYGRAIQLNPEHAETYLNVGALYGNRGMHREALPYFEEAAQRGDPRGAQYAQRAREGINEESAAEEEEEVGVLQLAINAFATAMTLDEMANAVGPYRFMIEDRFMNLMVDLIEKQIPPELHPDYYERLSWLQLIAYAVQK